MTCSRSQNTIWSATPSQMIRFPTYFFLLLLSPLIIPLFIILWVYLTVRVTEYTLFSSRLILQRGVLNKSTDTLQLYRVKDITIEEPLLLRLVNKGTIRLETSDKTHPTLRIEGISHPHEIAKQIGNLVETARRQKGVREVDVQ